MICWKHLVAMEDASIQGEVIDSTCPFCQTSDSWHDYHESRAEFFKALVAANISGPQSSVETAACVVAALDVMEEIERRVEAGALFVEEPK